MQKCLCVEMNENDLVRPESPEKFNEKTSSKALQNEKNKKKNNESFWKS